MMVVAVEVAAEASEAATAKKETKAFVVRPTAVSSDVFKKASRRSL